MIYIIHTVEVILTFLIIGLFVVCMAAIMIFVKEQCENWRRKKQEHQLIEANEKYLQYKCKQELHKREMKKYPLFYWRELIEEKLEDGNF